MQLVLSTSWVYSNSRLVCSIKRPRESFLSKYTLSLFMKVTTIEAKNYIQKTLSTIICHETNTWQIVVSRAFDIIQLVLNSDMCTLVSQITIIISMFLLRLLSSTLLNVFIHSRDMHKYTWTKAAISRPE